MHPNEKLLQTFYSSFQNRDYQGMINCYASDIEFSDAIFTLKGKAVGAMWHMLLGAGTDLKVDFKILETDEHKGQVHWEANYTLPRTKRKVHNIVEAEFSFVDGKITHHHDNFGFWRWTRMALGPMGITLGWLPMMQKKVQHQMQQTLCQFMEKHSEYR